MRSKEIIIFNIVAITNVTRCGNKNTNIIPIPSPLLGSELEGVNKTNSAPIYSKVIPSDILVKPKVKCFFPFYIQPSSVAFFTASVLFLQLSFVSILEI